MRIGNKTTL